MDRLNIAPDDIICSMDRISNLPGDVFRHIVSYLSAKEAACLKCAKNWKNLITIIPEIVFDLIVDINGSLLAQPADHRIRKFSLKFQPTDLVPMIVFDPLFDINGSFKKFVGSLLAQPVDYRIRSFSLILQCTDFDPCHYILVNDCLRDVLKRGVLALELNVNVKGDDYPLPSEVFACKSVVKMKLGSGFVIDIVPKNALLPALKTLILLSVRFYDLGGCAFTRLLSACPVLEELVVYGFNWEDWKWSHIVSSLTLKRLTLLRSNWYDWKEDKVPESESLSFDTPNLGYLEYTDVLHHAYPVVNLNSLVEAKINLRGTDFGDNKDLTNLIKGLKNVQNLRLGLIDTAMVFHCFSEVIPEFENMSHLSIPTETEVCWDCVQIFLKKSPNLKTLTIMNLHCPSVGSVCECMLGYSFLSSCVIKVLEITQFSGNIKEMVQLKHILKKLPCLELLEVDVQYTRHEEKLKIMADILMLPRFSTKCKIQVNIF